MIKVTDIGLSEDLKGFTRYLSQKKIFHRVVEESGRQSIYVYDKLDVEFVKKSLREFLLNEPALALVQDEESPLKFESVSFIFRGAYRIFFSSPVTLSLIATSLMVAFLTSMGGSLYGYSFMFYPLINSQDIIQLLGDISTPSIAVRTILPMFLHFGELHLVFNMVWLWYFGKQLEAAGPTWLLVAVILITAFVSNTSQYLAIGYNNFGGMSGVVYGLLGYTWVMHIFIPQRRLLINNSMFVFFVVALVLMELIASSWIATAAHLGGLLSGLVSGLFVVSYYRWIAKYITN